MRPGVNLRLVLDTEVVNRTQNSCGADAENVIRGTCRMVVRM
jgi:hypothetical protein